MNFFAAFFKISIVTAVILPGRLNWKTKTGILENGLEYCVINCKSCEVAAVSLSVKAGSSDNKVPGLLHLLEHMIYYSSKSYPEEGYFEKYITLRNGDFNAYTSNEITNFYYSIGNFDLYESLKIFSAGFYEAIFTEEAVRREISAVNSEHMKNLLNEGWLVFRLSQILIGGDFGKFGTGYQETLDIEDIEKIVEEAYDRYYIGSNIKVAIYANFTEETLEKWVLDCFNPVRSGEQNNHNKDPEISDKEAVAVRTSLIEGCSLEAFITVDSEYTLSEYTPARFLAYLLNNQGISGFKGNVPSIQTLISEIYEDFSSFSILHLAFRLDSHKDYKKILAMIKEYILVIKGKPKKSLEKAFEDYRNLKNINFEYMEVLDTNEFVSDISRNMIYLSEDRFVSGLYLCKKFDYDFFIQFLEKVLKSKVKAVLSCDYFTQGFDENLDRELVFNKMCNYYNMSFDIIPFPGSLSQSALDIFSENPYIPKSLKIIEKPSKSAERIPNSENYEIWYMFNNDFSIPKASISLFFTFNNWELQELPTELLLVNLEFELLLNHNLLVLSGYSMNYEISHKGATLILYGWNEGILNFLYQVLKILESPSPDFLNQSTLSLITKYSSFMNSQLYRQALKILDDRFYNSHNSAENKLETLKKGILQLPKLRKSFIKCLVFGNLEYDRKISKELKMILGTEPVKIREITKKLDLGDTEWFDSEFNYCVLNWYEFGVFDLETWAKLLVLESFASDRSFRELRTKRQLGYVVFTIPLSRYGKNGFVLIVQGAEKEAELALSGIQEFWNSFSLEENEVSQVKSGVKESLLWKAKNMEEIRTEVWREIEFDRYLFDINQKVSEKVDSVTLEDLRKMVKGIVNRDSNWEVKFMPGREYGLIENKRRV